MPLISRLRLFAGLILVCASLVILACNSGGGSGPDPDRTRPTVVSVFPAANTGNIALSIPEIFAVMSEDIEASTLTAASFTIAPALNVTRSMRGDTLVLSLQQELTHQTLYTLTLTTTIADPAGNTLAQNYVWSFTSQVDPNQLAPTIVSTSPANLAGNIEVDQPIRVTFSKGMDPATITVAGFYLSGGVTGTIGYSNRVATFTPTAALEYSTSYTATLTTAIADTFGLHLAADASFSFTTEADPYIPVVTLNTPFDSAITDDTVHLEVTATQPIQVVRVEFYIDGIHEPSLDITTPPYEIDYPVPGWVLGSTHTISARAYGPLGEVGHSDTVGVFYLWEPLVSDANDLWETDLKRVLARSSDSILELRFEFHEPYYDPYDTVPDDTTLDLGIYFDTDRLITTGRQTFAQSALNDIGADYRAIIGLHGLDTALARWIDPDWVPVYDITGFPYLNYPPRSTFLEVGLRWSQFVNSTGVDIVAINVFFPDQVSILPDWAPNQGNGHVTVLKAARFLGTQPVEPAKKNAVSEPRRPDEAVRLSPFR